MLVLLARPARARRIAADGARSRLRRHRRQRCLLLRRRTWRPAPVDDRTLSSSPDSGSKWLGDEVGQAGWQRRRIVELDLRAQQRSWSLPRGSRPAAARTRRMPPAYIRRSASSGRSCANGSRCAAHRASPDAPSSDDRASGSGSASRLRSSAPCRRRRSCPPSPRRSVACSRSMINSCSTASSCSQSSIGGCRPSRSSTPSFRPATSHCSG